MYAATANLPVVTNLPAKASLLKPSARALLQRTCACGEAPGLDDQCDECRQNGLGLQRLAASSGGPRVAPPIVHDVLRSPGQPLDPKTRAIFEPHFGHDFGKVQVHTDSRAAESARAVEARAFTVGRNIVFGSGQFAPSSGEGQRLLAHELTHVIQQNANSISTAPLQIGASDDRAESEADYFSTLTPRHVVQALTVNKSGQMVQREELPNNPPGAVLPGEANEQLSLSDEGLDFLARHEGCKLNSYNDSQGHCTVGIGHLLHQGKCNGAPSEAAFKDGILRDNAVELFRDDIASREDAITNALKIQINQYQYDALVSFVFNIGIGGFLNSGVLTELNKSNYSKVPAKMMEWTKNKELVGRRTDESHLFATGEYGQNEWECI